MNRKKNEIIFYIDSLLLSAFDDNPELSDLLKEHKISENNFTDKSECDNFVDLFPINRFQNYEYKYYEQAKLFDIFFELLKQNPKDIRIIKNISKVLVGLNAPDIALKYFEKELLLNEEGDKDITEILADIYFLLPEYYDESIKMFEKLVDNYNAEKMEYFYKLAFLYERIYQDKNLDKQIEYALKALKLTHGDTNLLKMFIAKLYYRKGLQHECYKYSDIVMRNEPTPEQKIMYCRFLMQNGKLKDAYDIYRCRFLTNNVAYPKDLKDDKRWNGKDDLSGATVIIHYEQGFGDTIMFIRYLPIISSMAKKVILVVQKSIIPILKSSGFDKYCEILSHEADINQNIKLENTNSSVMYSSGSGMSKIPHDYHIPMLDLPFLLDESPDRMTEAAGYLLPDEDKVNEFKKKYVKNNKKLKIGIAYRGSKESEVTYRDMTLQDFLPILNLKNIDVYLLQVDLNKEELNDIDTSNIIDLSDYLKDFGNTAAAISSMDLIISTDNVVMNLAGALAVKTYGLFNIYPESRWYKTEGDDIGWYKSVMPFKAKTFNDWDNVVARVKEQIKKDFKYLF